MYAALEEQRRAEHRRLTKKYGRVMRERDERESPIDPQAEGGNVKTSTALPGNAIEGKTTQP